MNVKDSEVKELEPGNSLIIKKDGRIFIEQTRIAKPKRACSFERIYFSRGSDKDIYTERKKLGHSLVPSILKSISYDIENTVFSYIPNTAETAFLGMIEGIEEHLSAVRIKNILKNKDNIDEKYLDLLLSFKPRMEKIAIKDVKLRTFITEDKNRSDMVEHVYDVTYGVIKEGTDNLVIIDDSIVRGTTLKQSILKILDRLGPKKIVVVSSSPQIRYPDCYGIDMAKLGDLCAFRAAIELLKEKKMDSVINEVYNQCKAQANKPKEEMKNYIKRIYDIFSDEEISVKISQMLKPENIKSEVAIIFQSIDGLHKACPNHSGDWYFTGDYPTPGGNRAASHSFVNYIEKRNTRSY